MKDAHHFFVLCHKVRIMKLLALLNCAYLLQGQPDYCTILFLLGPKFFEIVGQHPFNQLGEMCGSIVS